jgi:hypothetical protein
MKRVRVIAGLGTAATGLVLGAQAVPGVQAATLCSAFLAEKVMAPPAERPDPLATMRCWTINAANIRMFFYPDKSPFFTTKKGQELVASGSPVAAGGKEWWLGADVAYHSPPTGWIARNYLTKRTC